MKAKVLDKTAELYSGVITILPDKSVEYKYHKVRRYHETSTLIYISDDTDDPYQIVYNKTYAYIHPQPSVHNLYIDKKARISRDLLRNSGYKLVRDEDKANFTVIPYYDKNRFHQLMNFTFGFICDGNAYTYRLDSKINNGSDKLSQEEADILVDDVCAKYNNPELFYNIGSMDCVLCGIPICVSYVNILENRNNNHYYIFDTAINYVNSVDINIETLEIWSRCNDVNLLEKQIINSNWRDYPCTLAYVLNSCNSHVRFSTNANMRMILDTIHFDDAYKRRYHKYIITADDWNMLQKWIMHQLGVSEKGGYVTKDEFDNINYRFDNILRSRIAVIPTYVNYDSTFGDFQSLTEH